MSSGHQRITWRRNIAENFNRLSRVHERYRQTTDRQTTDDRRTDGRRHIANMNMSSRSLIKTLKQVKQKTSRGDVYICTYNVIILAIFVRFFIMYEQFLDNIERQHCSHYDWFLIYIWTPAGLLYRLVRELWSMNYNNTSGVTGNGSMNQRMNEWMNEWMKKWMNE